MSCQPKSFVCGFLCVKKLPCYLFSLGKTDTGPSFLPAQHSIHPACLTTPSVSENVMYTSFRTRDAVVNLSYFLKKPTGTNLSFMLDWNCEVFKATTNKISSGCTVLEHGALLVKHIRLINLTVAQHNYKQLLLISIMLLLHFTKSVREKRTQQS